MSINQAAKRIRRRLWAGDVVTAELKLRDDTYYEVLGSWIQIGGTGPMTPNPQKTIQAMLDRGEMRLQEKLSQEEGTEGALWRLSLAENAPQSTQEKAESPLSLSDEELRQPIFKASEKPPKLIEGPFNCLILVPAGTLINWTSPSLNVEGETWKTPEDLQALAVWVPGQHPILQYWERPSAPHMLAYVEKHLVQFLQLPPCSICQKPSHQVLKGRYCCNKDACMSQVRSLDSEEKQKPQEPASEYHEMIAEMYPGRYTKPDPALPSWSSELADFFEQLRQRITDSSSCQRDRKTYPSLLQRAPFEGETEALQAAWAILKQHLIYTSDPAPVQALAEYQDYLSIQRAKYQAIEQGGKVVFQAMLESLTKAERALTQPQKEQQHARTQ